MISVDVPWLVRRTMWVERAPPLPPAPEVSPCTLDHGKSPCFSFSGPWLQYLYVKYITRRYQGVNPKDLIGLGIDINYGFIGITMSFFVGMKQWNGVINIGYSQESQNISNGHFNGKIRMNRWADLPLGVAKGVVL